MKTLIIMFFFIPNFFLVKLNIHLIIQSRDYTEQQKQETNLQLVGMELTHLIIKNLGLTTTQHIVFNTLQN